MKNIILITISLFILIILGMTFFNNNTNKQSMFPDKYQIAVWDWNSPLEYNIPELSSKLVKLKEYKVNSIYIDISGYVDVKEGNNLKDLALFENKIQELIKIAKDNDVKVFAMAGAINWSEPDYRYVPLVILNYVFEFNRTHDFKFAGLQFDIESYNLPNASTNDDVMINYLDTIKELSVAFDKLNQDNTLDIGFAIPFWLDGTNKEFGKYNWNKQNKYVTYHILDILNSVNNSSIIVMDYRNYTQGEDGSINNISQELNYISELAPNVGLLIGLETTNEQPSKITYYSMNKNNLINDFSEIVNHYKNNQSIKGLAIHTLDGFLELK